MDISWQIASPLYGICTALHIPAAPDQLILWLLELLYHRILGCGIPETENFPYNSRRTGKTGNSERQVSAMQDQGHGQKSRNQAPDPRTEPQAGRMQNKKKDQPQDKEGKTQRY